MKRRALKSSLFVFLMTSVAALAVTEEKLDRRFTVQTGGTLVVDVDFGSISVSTNATSEVVVEVWRKIGRRKKADEEAFLRDNPVTFTQDGNTVTIQSRGKNRSSWSWTGRNQNDAKYTISVPARFDARLKTGGGGIDVVDLTGEVQADTGGGGLTFTRLHGPLHGNTGGGGIKARACEGKLTLRTGGGGIETLNSSGSLEGSTGGGGITVKEFQGPAHLNTGGGGLTIEKVEGAVDAATGGGSINAVLPSEVAEPVKLSTGGGGISVAIPGTAAFTLDARTHGGGVSSELPVTVVGKVEEGRLQGPVNGGGKSVQLTSGGGSIRIKKL